MKILRNSPLHLSNNLSNLFIYLMITIHIFEVHEHLDNNVSLRNCIPVRMQFNVCSGKAAIMYNAAASTSHAQATRGQADDNNCRDKCTNTNKRVHVRLFNVKLQPRENAKFVRRFYRGYPSEIIKLGYIGSSRQENSPREFGCAINYRDGWKCDE